MSRRTRFVFMEWSFEMMPRPVHGASSKTRSNVLGKIYGYFLPSLQVMTVLVMPRR